MWKSHQWIKYLNISVNPVHANDVLPVWNVNLLLSSTGISVSISTFSLVAIAIERYSAICNPLKSRAWQTRSHAYKVIAMTWALSFLIMTPYPIFSSLVSYPKTNNITAHKCRHDWPKDQVKQAWWVIPMFGISFKQITYVQWDWRMIRVDQEFCNKVWI